MADEEKIENLPPSDDSQGEGNKSGGGGSPWIPVLVMILLIPVLSFVMTNFLVVPKMKHLIEESVKELSKEETKEEAAAAEGPVQTYEFEDIVANLAGALRSRYVKVSFTVEGTIPNFVEYIEKNKAKIIDTTLGILSSLNIMDLEQPGFRNIVRNDLLSAFENALKGNFIQQLYFSEFVIQ